MAKSVIINGVTYPNVPNVTIPLAGQTGNATFYETSDADISANHVLAGKIAYGASGRITGTLSSPVVSQDSQTGVLTVS